MTERTENSERLHSNHKKGMGRRLEAAGWGLFFVWVGASLLMDLTWSVGLIGVAAIILLGQVARRYFGLRIESFWLVVGVLFLLGGVWELYQIRFGLVPILLIVAGGALLLSLLQRGSSNDWFRWCGGSRSRSADRWRCCSWSASDR